ncbi:uncharacterized protein LOC141674980 [Apium graveolens]|uniref:uncharacterized protein LOC141674980 n=1 Tax=Apium graveolens TaxID=4045 RepID=UPI003D7B0C80
MKPPRRFISKLAERFLPFFDLLKGATNKREVNWSPECQNAFEEIKRYLSQPSLLTKAKPGEPLSFYLSAGALAVGAALIREENGKQQPVYYVSQVLKDAETRYPRLEKFAFALVTTSRKPRHYFQGREIWVVTNQPLRKIIHKPDISGRLVNWAVELSQFNLSFIPRTAIKAQALADFIIECNFPEEEPIPMSIEPGRNNDQDIGAWALKVDGSSTNERSGAGLILKSPEGFTIQTAISFGFSATNNQAEYEALIAGLKLAKTLKIQDLKIYSDSQIVVKQTNGEEENSEADTLSKLVQNSSDLDCSVYFEELQKPSIEAEVVMEIGNSLNWMTLFINYLEKGELPEDKGKAQRLKAKASKFFIEEGILYRRTFSSPTMKCIGPGEAQYYLMEVHEGICGDHMSAKALAHKIIRQGYYWPTIHQDAIKFVKKTSPRTSTGETPFKLAYGTEAMLPIEVGSPSHRAINFDEITNEEGLRTNIELIDEVRDQAVARMEKYKEKTKEHFNKKSRVKNFQVGDLVLRDKEASDPTNTGKLMPRWEGPYKVKEVLRPGTYKLMNMDESEIPNTWHGLRLRKFYQ